MGEVEGFVQIAARDIRDSPTVASNAEQRNEHAQPMQRLEMLLNQENVALTRFAQKLRRGKRSKLCKRIRQFWEIDARAHPSMVA